MASPELTAMDEVDSKPTDSEAAQLILSLSAAPSRQEAEEAVAGKRSRREMMPAEHAGSPHLSSKGHARKMPMLDQEHCGRGGSQAAGSSSGGSDSSSSSSSSAIRRPHSSEGGSGTVLTWLGFGENSPGMAGVAAGMFPYVHSSPSLTPWAAGAPPSLTPQMNSSSPLTMVPLGSLAGGSSGFFSLGAAAVRDLPEPTCLSLLASTTTSLQIEWGMNEKLTMTSMAKNLFWFVQFCKAGDTQILGGCSFPLHTLKASVKSLQPGISYKVMLRLELRQHGLNQSASDEMEVETGSSAWVADVFQTLDVSGIPARPPKPIVRRITSKVAELSIVAAPCCKDGMYRCATSFMLQRLEGAMPDDPSLAEDGWKSVPESTVSCQHPKEQEIVPSLKKRCVPLSADRIYHFRVRAINYRGASKWSQVATTLPPPSSPDVVIDNVTSSSVSLSWKPPEGNGSELSSYIVCHHQADDDGDAMVETCVPSPGKSSQGNDEGATETQHEPVDLPALVSFEVTGLRPNSSYKFFVKAISDAGTSDPCLPLNILTLPLPPTRPSILKASDVRSNSFNLEWTFPDETDVNATTTCEVSWSAVEQDPAERLVSGEANTEGDAVNSSANQGAESEKWGTKEIPCKEGSGTNFSCEIDGLKTDVLYYTSVRGKNGSGEGPWSERFVVRTNVPAPFTPMIFHSSETSATSTTLCWGKTLDEAFPVTAYEIRQWRSIDEKDPSAMEKCVWKRITPTDAGADTLSKVMDGLMPGVEYVFQLRGINKDTLGEPSEPLRLTTMCQVPPPPGQPCCLEATPSTIMLHWSPPSTDNGSVIVAYSLQMRMKGQVKYETVFDDIGNDSAEVSCLEPKASYIFRVRARNVMGWGRWSQEFKVETKTPAVPESPTSLECLPAHNSVTIMWPHLQMSVTRYVVEMLDKEWSEIYGSSAALDKQLTRLKRDRRKIDFHGGVCIIRKRPMLAFSVEGLEPGVDYSFRIVAQNCGGEARSEVLTVCTLSDAKMFLSAEEAGKLKQLCDGCDCSEYYERFLQLGYDAETLSRMPQSEVFKVFDKVQVLSKHVNKLCDALFSPLSRPSKPYKVAIKSDSFLISWDAPKSNGYPMSDFIVQYAQCGGQEDDPQDFKEIRCNSNLCQISNLVADSEYSIRVCSAGGQSVTDDQWSPIAKLWTSAAVCPDAKMKQCLRSALNSSSYADKVAAQLYQEQWTFELLQEMPSEELSRVLQSIKVKEGAILSILNFFESKNAELK